MLRHSCADPVQFDEPAESSPLWLWRRFLKKVLVHLVKYVIQSGYAREIVSDQGERRREGVD